jgi:ComF family protein
VAKKAAANGSRYASSFFFTPARYIAESLFATFFPSDCRICNDPLIKISRFPVCENCVAVIRPITEDTCDLCGERITISAFAQDQSAEDESADDEDLLCELCRRAAPIYAQAVAYGSYDGNLREVIHLLKYGGVRTSANVLGLMLSRAIEKLPSILTKAEVLVIPVPLHARKKHQRGFNQAELIARCMLKKMPESGLRLNTKVLSRVRMTKSQIGLTRHQRRENLRGSFSVSRPLDVVGREVLLIDDVFTTGTTVSECTRVLLRAGASNVYVATVARTLKTHAHYVEPDFESESAITMAKAG